MIRLAAVILAALSSACTVKAPTILYDPAYPALGTSPPEPLTAPIARTSVLLWELDDTKEPPQPTAEALDRAAGRPSGSQRAQALSPMMPGAGSVVSPSTGVAIGGALLDNDYRFATTNAIRAMRAVSEDATDARLYLFVRVQRNQSLKPATATALVHAYLRLPSGEVLHARRSMAEHLYLASQAPASTPAGMVEPPPEQLDVLLNGPLADRPYGYVEVLAAWAIDDLHRQLKRDASTP